MSVILNVDLSQAELRAMAMLSDDEWMIAALQEGEGDFFNNHMMPTCFPWIEAEYGTVQAYQDAEPVEHKENRTMVKGIQYGLAFGRGAPAIARALGLPVKDAQQIIDRYLTTASNFAQWRQDVMEAAIRPGKRDLLVNPFGRRFQAEVITPDNFHSIQREALSFLPQSTSSDICLMSAMTLHSTIKDTGLAKIVNVVHDAIMVECDNEEVAEELGQYTGNIMRSVGESVMGDSVPFLSDYSYGKSWADLD